jgi:hypothetical protein
VGGASPDSLLRAAHASDHPADEGAGPFPGTQVLRERLSSAPATVSVA